jgi:hypothetical protein
MLRARHAAKASGINPEEAFSKRMRDAKAQAEAGSEDHKKSMQKLGEKMAELRAKRDLIPLKNVQQSNMGEDSGTAEQGQAAGANSVVVAPKDITRPQNNNKRKSTTKESEDRATKKGKMLKEHAKQVTKKADPALKGEPVGAVSSTLNASDPMDASIEPSSTLFVPENGPERYPAAVALPNWYTDIKPSSAIFKTLSMKRPPELTALDALKAVITQCEEASKRRSELHNLCDKLRDSVHKAEITLTVTPHILRKANMLSPQVGLPRIFKDDAKFPPDLKSDAYQLYLRWYKNDLTQDILRGIVTKKANNRTSDSISDTYRVAFPSSAKYYGQGALVLGQWWPTQLCTVRDGAHGAAQGGIFGEKDHGSYSIVLSGGSGYNDKDDGDTIQYSGTEGKNGVPSENTTHLLTSHKLKNEIRVIRSSQLNKKNQYRPERGLKYDGLHRVTGFEVTDREKAMHRFPLERCEGQEEIRWRGKAKRPTEYEVREYERLKEKGAWV